MSNRRVTNRWHPPCGCEIEFEFMTDEFDEPIDSSKNIFEVHYTCPRHTATPFKLNSHPLDEEVNVPRKEQKLLNDTLIALDLSDVSYTFKDGKLYLMFPEEDRVKAQEKVDTIVGKGRVRLV